MPSEHDKIDTQKVIASLNTILELELAGVVRYVAVTWNIFGGTPGTPANEHERGFDGMLAVLRRDLDLGQLLHVERLGLGGW